MSGDSEQGRNPSLIRDPRIVAAMIVGGAALLGSLAVAVSSYLGTVSKDTDRPINRLNTEKDGPQNKTQIQLPETLRVIDVAFAAGIKNMEPDYLFNPPGHCVNGNAGDSLPSPIIDSEVFGTVYFWNKINSSGQVTLLHSWHKDGLHIRTKRTRTSVITKETSVVGDVEPGEGWKDISDVEDFKVDIAEGWRIWSSKEIDPVVHVGKWKVEVSPAAKRKHILCTAHFEIR